MKIKTFFLKTFVLLILLIILSAYQEDSPVLKGPYLGQKPPGMTPEIFAPDIISTGIDEKCAVFAPDGREFFYGVVGHSFCFIASMKQENDAWTQPQIVPFSITKRYISLGFNLSPDGQNLYFTAFRPQNGGNSTHENCDLWVLHRTRTGWSEPENLGAGINTGRGEYYPSVTNDGTLFFYRQGEDVREDRNIYSSCFADGKYAESQKLGESINSDFDEEDPFIAPDESFLIFCSRNRPDGYGNFDLYISFRNIDGTWTQAKNMGSKINSSQSDVSPSISPDGKYFFFSSHRRNPKSYPATLVTYEDKMRILDDELNSPGNAALDIYWVDAKIIEELEPDDLK